VEEADWRAGAQTRKNCKQLTSGAASGAAAGGGVACTRRAVVTERRVGPAPRARTRTAGTILLNERHMKRS
jgi:hypothetical protein